MTHSSDLELTRELCRKPGVLKDSLQTAYWIVRDGLQVEVPLDELSRAEGHVISEELRRQGDIALREAGMLEIELERRASKKP